MPGDVLFAFLGSQDCKSGSLQGLRLWEAIAGNQQLHITVHVPGPRWMVGRAGAWKEPGSGVAGGATWYTIY